MTGAEFRAALKAAESANACEKVPGRQAAAERRCIYPTSRHDPPRYFRAVFANRIGGGGDGSGSNGSAAPAAARRRT